MINLTVTKHRDDILGNGYYIASETMDKTWYKGDTSYAAIRNFSHDTGYDGMICFRECDENE